MAGNDASTKFFDALNEGYDALIDAIRAANDRGHRVSIALIEDAQRGQREAVELTRKWIESPFDVVGLSGSVIDTATKAQSRSLDVARQWFGEMADAQQESRQVLQRMVSASRNAGEAAVSGARGVFTRASEVVQSSAQSTATPAGDGRRGAREPARTAESPRSAEPATEEPD